MDNENIILIGWLQAMFDGAATAGVYYNADKIHPNYAGHTIMLGIIQPVVEAQRLA